MAALIALTVLLFGCVVVQKKAAITQSPASALPAESIGTASLHSTKKSPKPTAAAGRDHVERLDIDTPREKSWSDHVPPDGVAVTTARVNAAQNRQNRPTQTLPGTEYKKLLATHTRINKGSPNTSSKPTTAADRDHVREQSPSAKDIATSKSSESTQSDKLPPFFPPTATNSVELPVEIAGKALTLQQCADRLKNALVHAEYEGRFSFYWVDDQHGPGFAIVTEVEAIQSDGKPVGNNQRWGFHLPEYDGFTPNSLWKAMIHADLGRYRLIALVLSKQPFKEQDTAMTQEQAETLKGGPAWLGDSPWKTVVATPDFHLMAYVYEFERKSRSDPPVLMPSDDLGAKNHLQSTALYDDIQEEFPSTR
jgi:hypothetical protein